MEIIKQWIVAHRLGRTVLYLLEDGNYIMMIPTPTGNCWTDIAEYISECKALKYINDYKLLTPSPMGDK